MSEPMDMSLDEIIKANKKTLKKTQNNKRGGFRAKPNKNSNHQGNKKFGGVQKSRQNNLHSKKPAQNNAWKKNFAQGNAKRETLVKDARQLLQDKNTPTRIVISNLHFGVTDENIRDLFSLVGKLKKAALHYDSNGKSLGTAEVLFFKREDAIQAIKKYNGMPLDGRKMVIQLTTSEILRKPANNGNVKKFNNVGKSGFKNQPRRRQS